MNATPVDARIALLSDLVRRSLVVGPRAWFDGALGGLRRQDGPRLDQAIGLAPRKLGKADILPTPDDLRRADESRTGFDPTGLSVDQAARIAFLLADYRGDDAAFAARVADIYRVADLSESIAILRGLPLLPGPKDLLPVAAEGVRSAVRPVFEAVAHRNPYPSEMFDQNAWNQMVLKALFIGSALSPIQRLDERANRELAEVLVDYAHERWAAGRPVSPELWRCVGPYADQRTLEDLERVLATGTQEERAAAFAALQASPLPGAAAILARDGELPRGPPNQ